MQTSRPSREQPTNQALVLSWVVPVLPHTWKSWRAARAVPPGSVTPDIASTTWSATAAGSARRTGSGCAGSALSTRPSTSRTSSSVRGAMRTPPLSSVPYALAIDCGLTSAVVPRPNDDGAVAKASSSATTPASSMSCLIRSRPASMASGT